MNAGQALGPSSLESWGRGYLCEEGIIGYTDTKIDGWAGEDEPYFAGYFNHDWDYSITGVEKLDTEAKSITFKKPWSPYGYLSGCRCYGLNLKCEVDMPGEYYIDRKDGIIYFCAPEGFDGTGTALSVFGGASMIFASDCKGFTVKDLKMIGGRDGAITILSGSDNLIDGCEFTRFGNVVITIDGGTGHTVHGCYIHETGQAGIESFGGDRATLTPAGFRFCDNIIEDIALYMRTYRPGIHFNGVGATVEHNRFQNMPSSAVRLEGNDINTEYNQFFDVVKESDDQGGSDSWGDYTYRRINFRHNHWKNIHGGTMHGAAGIRFDDLVCGNIVEGEIFESCGDKRFGGVQIHSGKDIIVRDCVFYGCPKSVTDDPESAWYFHYFLDLYPFSNDLIDSPVYLERYPEMRSGFDSNQNINYVHNNLVVGGTLEDIKDFVIWDNTVIPEMDKPISYWLQDDVLASYGIKPIPFSEIGPRDNKFDNK